MEEPHTETAPLAPPALLAPSTPIVPMGVDVCLRHQYFGVCGSRRRRRVVVVRYWMHRPFMKTAHAPKLFVTARRRRESAKYVWRAHVASGHAQFDCTTAVVVEPPHIAGVGAGVGGVGESVGGEGVGGVGGGVGYPVGCLVGYLVGNDVGGVGAGVGNGVGAGVGAIQLHQYVYVLPV